MLKIKIVSVSKTSEEWLASGIEMYAKRLKSQASFTFLWCKSEKEFEKEFEKERDPIVLDERGKVVDSVEFSTLFFKKMEEGGSKVTFFIGPAEGLPAHMKNASTLVSLSKLTFTHQMIRLILVEQIFRAFEINKGSHYHK